MEDDNANFGEQNSLQQPAFNEPQIHSVDSSRAMPSSMPPVSFQGTPLNSTTQEESADSAANIDKKIKFWKKFSIILGLVTFFGYILILIGANVLAHGTQFGWVIFMMFGMVWHGLIFALFTLSLISFIRVIVLSSRRKKHIFKDYVMVVIGLLLIFSPYVISGVLSLFRISWNENSSVSVTLRSKDPYNLSGDSTWGALDCTEWRATKESNNLKDVDIDEYYSYVDGAEERKLFAAKGYVRQIGEEILCQVKEFHEERGRYPDESEIESFSSSAVSDDVRNGKYNIKLEVGAEPNNEDFTVLFDRNCTNKTTKNGNVVVLSPLYGDRGRYCVYQTINEIWLEEPEDNSEDDSEDDFEDESEDDSEDDYEDDSEDDSEDEEI